MALNLYKSGSSYYLTGTFGTAGEEYSAIGGSIEGFDSGGTVIDEGVIESGYLDEYLSPEGSSSGQALDVTEQVDYLLGTGSGITQIRAYVDIISIHGDDTVYSNYLDVSSSNENEEPSGTLTLSDDLVLSSTVTLPSGWYLAESEIHTPSRTLYDTLSGWSTDSIDLKDHMLNNEWDTISELTSGSYYVRIGYFYGNNAEEERSVYITSNTVNYITSEDEEYVAPSCTDLKVTYTDGSYILTGTFDEGSHNIADMAIEDPLCGNAIDELSFYDYTASVQSFKDSLASGIDLSSIVSQLGSGEFYVDFGILDESENNPNPDGTSSWSFRTAFTVEAESTIDLNFDATTGTITGSVNLTGEGYVLEDVGSIRKCASGNTIDLTNDEYVTDVLYFSDFSDIDSINSALASGITTASEYPSILDGLKDNGTGYYYVQWYLINNTDYTDKEFYSPVVYYEAEEEPDVKYFNNEELNSLWNRLVKAVNKLPIETSWGPVTFDNSNMQGNVWLNTTYNVIETVDAIEYSIYNSAGTVVKSGYGYYDDSMIEQTTTPLTDLPNGTYTVETTSSGATGDDTLVGLRGTLTIGSGDDASLKTGSVKWVHDKLISYTKLSHNNTPETTGDYMKGIAVCARYLSTKQVNTTTLNSLLQIVGYVEQEV